MQNQTRKSDRTTLFPPPPLTLAVHPPVAVFGTTRLRHSCNNRRGGEIETKWDILTANTLLGIQIETERYSRRRCTAEQTNPRVNNRTRGQAKEEQQHCVEFVLKKRNRTAATWKRNRSVPIPVLQQIKCYFFFFSPAWIQQWSNSPFISYWVLHQPLDLHQHGLPAPSFTLIY